MVRDICKTSQSFAASVYMIYRCRCECDRALCVSVLKSCKYVSVLARTEFLPHDSLYVLAHRTNLALHTVRCITKETTPTETPNRNIMLIVKRGGMMANIGPLG